MLNGRPKGYRTPVGPYVPTRSVPVIVCHCRAVSDRSIRSAIRCGADDLGAVTDLCGAGGDCGGCRLRIEHLLAVERPVLVRVAS
jgi:bacterioferritin-associated ferredoxin